MPSIIREAEKLRDIQQLAAGNGVTDLRLLGRTEVQDMEPGPRDVLRGPPVPVHGHHRQPQVVAGSSCPWKAQNISSAVIIPDSEGAGREERRKG